jgi:hypothetical protein
MATGFTAGTPLGSQYQYTPITFAPLLSLVPQRPAAAPEAPAPTGLEATAQMPVPQYMGGQEGPGGEMQPFNGQMVGEKSFGQVMSEVGRGISMVSNPLPQLISLITTGKTLMENLGLFGSQQQQQQAPVVTLSPEAIALSQQMGIPASEAQGLIDMGIGFAANIEGQANVPGNNLGDVGFSGEPGGGPVSGEGMGAPPAEAAAGMGPGW